jgi:DnaJ-class molecular chaperone
MIKWYPAKRIRPITKALCPVCEGAMAVIDKRTQKQRPCVACKGKGHYLSNG